MPPLPPSPFGPAPAFDLEGLRFGALIPSSERGVLHGFFVDHAALAPRLRAFAEACPGASLDEALTCVMLPSPIRALLEDWREDWKARSERERPAQSGGKLFDSVQAMPWTLRKSQREEPMEERFAWLKVDAPRSFVRESATPQILALWRAELESQGLGTAPWSDRSLQMINNGFSDHGTAAAARLACADAFLARDLRRDLPPAPRAGSARM